MYNGINEMIDDPMDHISLENTVLFPRPRRKVRKRKRVCPGHCPSYLATLGGLYDGRCKQR